MNASKCCIRLGSLAAVIAAALFGSAGIRGVSAAATAAAAEEPSTGHSAPRVGLWAADPQGFADAEKGALGTNGAACGLRAFVLQG